MNKSIQTNRIQQAFFKLAIYAVYFHIAVYVLVMTLLIYINLTTQPEYYWFKWVLLAWGIGVLFHGLGTLFAKKFFNKYSVNLSIKQK